MTVSASPSYPLSDALAYGVPHHVRDEARHAGRIDLTRPDGSHVPFFLVSPNWNRNGGTWYAKAYRNSRTQTGYAGGHAPRGEGIAGLSADGVRRALDALDRQDRGPVARCRCCGSRVYGGHRQVSEGTQKGA